MFFILKFSLIVYHQTVTHQQAFVNPITGAHTQAIETNWGHLKTKILRQMRGTKEHLIPGHLAEYWWKGVHKETPFWDIFTRVAAGLFLAKR